MRIITLSTKKTLFFLTFLAFFISLNNSLAQQCPIIVNSSQSFCDSRPSPAKVSDLVAIDNGGGIKWYTVPTSGTALNPSTILNSGSYYADNNTGTCATRPRVDVVFYIKPSPVDLPSPTFCVASTVANLQQKIAGNDLRWYLSPTGGSQLASSLPLINNTDYYASQFISSSGCETLRSRIRVKIVILDPPTGNPLQSICSNPSPKISDFIVNIDSNNSISWYYPSGVEILDPSNTLIQEGDVYKVTQSDSNCESLGLSVSSIFEDPNNAGTNGAKSYCVSDLPTTLPFNLYDLLGGNPDKTGVWTGDLPTIDGYLGKVDISSLSPGDYYFNYEVSTSTKCANSSSKVTITVLPLPTVSISTKRPTVCSGTPSRIDFEGTPLATVIYKVNGVINTIVLDSFGEASINTSQNHTYELVSVAYSGTPSCSQNITGIVTITVLPLPTVSISTNTPNVCSGTVSKVEFKGTPLATVTYTENGVIKTISLNAAGEASLDATQSGTYALVSVASNGTPSCSQNQTGSVTVTVLPLPTVSISTNTPNICSGTASKVEFKGTPLATVTYTENGVIKTISLNAAGEASLDATQSGTYTLVSVASNGTLSCSQNQTGSVTVTVLPLPTVSISTNTPNICSGTASKVEFKGTPLATVTYTENGVIKTISLNAAGEASLDATQNGTYTLVSVASNGTPSCSQNLTGSVTIKVLPIPTASFSTKSPIVCSGNLARLDFEGTPLATVTYTENGVVKTIQLNIDGEAEVPVNQNSVYNLISVSYDDIPSCSQNLTGSLTITVLPLPTAIISTKTPTICSGDSARIDFEGTPLALVTYTLDGVTNTILLDSDGEASLIATQNSIYTLVSVAYSTTPSCIQNLTGSVTVTVLPIPTASFSTKSPIVCSGNPARLDFEGTPLATVTYTENGVVKTIQLNTDGEAEVPVNQNSVYNLISVSYEDLPSCSQNLTGSVTITVLPLPTVIISTKTPTICSESSARIDFEGTPLASVIYTVDGVSNTILLDSDGEASFDATQNSTYTLVSVASSGTPSCNQNQAGSVTITVLPLPTVSISTKTPTICSQSSARIDFEGTPLASVNYTVDGVSNMILLDSDGESSLNTNQNSVYELVSVSYVALPSCSQNQTGSVTITVLPLPTVTISTKTPTICSESSARIDFEGTPLASVIYTVDGVSNTILLDSDGEASFDATQNSTYTLVSIASSGTPSCNQNQAGSVTITVLPLPTVSISTKTPIICSQSSARIDFEGTPLASVIYTVDGVSNTILLDSDGEASLDATQNSTYTLVSVASSGTPSCRQNQTGSVTITVLPLPTASISTKSPIVCSGLTARLDFEGTPLTIVSFTVNGIPDTIQLDSDGEASLNANQNSVYELVSVSYVDLLSCSQNLTGNITITVLPLPTVSISTKTPTICSQSSARIDFEGTPLASVIYTVDGVSNTIQLDSDGEASLDASQNSTYTLVSVASIGTPSCSQNQTGSVTIKVLPLPTASISTKSPIVCSGLPARVDFEGTPLTIVSFTVNGIPDTIQLDSDGEASLNANQNSVYELVSVSYIDLLSCSQNLTGNITITVLPLPTVSISTKTPTICSESSARIDFEGTPLASVIYTVDGVSNTIQLDSDGEASLDSTQNSIYTLVSVSSSGSPSCTKLLTDSVTISINPKPTVSISSSGTSCSGNAIDVTFTGTPNANVTYRINGGVVQNINIGSSGVAVLNIILSATSTFKLESITLINPPNCSQLLSEETIINVTQPPVAGSNANLSICSDAIPQDLYLLLGSSAQSGGTWFPTLISGTGFFDPKVDLEGSYIYTVAGTPPCVNDTALVTVTIVPAANSGSDGVANLCSNSDTVDLKTFLVGSPQTGGTWSPTLTSGTGIFDPSVDLAEKYTYTVKGVGSCTDAKASVVVSIVQGPNAGISGSTTFCEGSSAKDLFLSLGGKPQTGGTWFPTLTSGSGIFDPTLDKAGDYSYSFSGSQPCDNDTATVTVILNPSPNAGEDNTASICSNVNGSDLFTFLRGNPQLGGTWTPPLVSGTGFFDPKKDAAGEYTYTVGNPFCTPDEAKISVTIIPGPDAGLPGDITFCATSLPQSLFSSLKGTPQVGGTWTSPNGAISTGVFDPKVDLPGVYTYTFEGSQPCDDDTATVTVTVDPIVNAGTFVGIQNVCTSIGSFDLYSLLKDSIAGGTWTDSNNQTVTSPVEVSKLTPNTYSYTYTVTNACGTDNEVVQFVILLNPVLASKNIAISSPNCKGNNVTVTLSNMENGVYTINYNLSISNVLTNQNANVTIVNGKGTFDISAADIPNLGTTRVTFLTITNALTNCVTAINPNVSADFILRQSSNLENKNIVIADVCEGSDVTVTISGASNGLADGNYQFIYTIPDAVPSSGTTGTIAIANGTGQFIIPASNFVNAASYTLTISSITNLSSGCNNLTEDANTSFQVFPLPNATGAILSSASACLNFSNEVSLSRANAISDGFYDITYELSGVSSSSITVNVEFVGGETKFVIPASVLNTAGNVTVTIDKIISSVSQCDTSGSAVLPISFEVFQLDTPIIKDKGNEFCKNDNPTIANLSDNVSGSEPLVWYDDATGTNVLNSTDLLEDGNSYFATLKSASGCESVVRLEVVVDLTKCKDILIPDGFSPNGDTVNDEFVIKNIESAFPNFTLEIYNRYGNILYKGNKNTPNWDGTTTQGGIKIGDAILPVGVYFYILEYNDGKTSPKQGRLYLSR
ncbi:T9SS type B sorting domain-containing protein [Flavobacterium luteum]|uniref:T9SS type B sorting domain-containing protein n=1 Tax=Flavobacterium luteum TaxID=2026654 RepID=A0A7J5ADD9_9FLAO|nr:gliding motility-associated C-terminal domain-containing protein [Flavobacterium luteum]KAB1155540.1 T9SS type B sorting domain-containing protein [Flavobacterium luteum]